MFGRPGSGLAKGGREGDRQGDKETRRQGDKKASGQGGRPMSATPATSPRRRWRGALLFVPLPLCLLVWCGWQWWRGPPPPAVERSGLDPAAAKAVDEATAAVERSPRSAAAWGHLGMVLQAHDFN